MLVHPRCLTISAADKATLNILLLAKHANADGSLDAIDGNHAVYHHELRVTLESIGLQIKTADSFRGLLNAEKPDFLFTLLNRGGFENSEMLAPLIARWNDVPCLGASPIIRGLADDKHLSKMIAKLHGIPTMQWQVFRRGGLNDSLSFKAERYVVKPNASSASWGLNIVDNNVAVHGHISELFDQGHDVIVEEWVPEVDIAVPVIGGSDNKPWILPPMMCAPSHAFDHRAYAEKRGLVKVNDDPLEVVTDKGLVEKLERCTKLLLPELWPFDYGRLEFRVDTATGTVRFMEVNLSCNLWSKKTISRSAATIGVGHESLVETIVAHSMLRQGAISMQAATRAA